MSEISLPTPVPEAGDIAASGSAPRAEEAPPDGLDPSFFDDPFLNAPQESLTDAASGRSSRKPGPPPRRQKTPQPPPAQALDEDPSFFDDPFLGAPPSLGADRRALLPGGPFGAPARSPALAKEGSRPGGGVVVTSFVSIAQKQERADAVESNDAANRSLQRFMANACGWMALGLAATGLSTQLFSQNAALQSLLKDHFFYLVGAGFVLLGLCLLVRDASSAPFVLFFHAIAFGALLSPATDFLSPLVYFLMASTFGGLYLCGAFGGFKLDDATPFTIAGGIFIFVLVALSMLFEKAPLAAGVVIGLFVFGAAAYDIPVLKKQHDEAFFQSAKGKAQGAPSSALGALEIRIDCILLCLRILLELISESARHRRRWF